jgi:hypothetical protein
MKNDGPAFWDDLKYGEVGRADGNRDCLIVWGKGFSHYLGADMRSLADPLTRTITTWLSAKPEGASD